MWLALFVLLHLLLPSTPRADDRVMLSPGPGYHIRWSAGSGSGFDAYPSVDHPGWSPVDRWFQVAPGGGYLAVWTERTGLVVLASNGDERWRRKGRITAFRFSANGDRLAFATARGIEILLLDKLEVRRLSKLEGVDWLCWTDPGLVARTRSTLELILEDGRTQTLARVGPAATVAAARNRLVFFSPSTLHEIDLARGSRRTSHIKLGERNPITNAALAPDGTKLLFATSKRVYLREGTAPAQLLVETDEVSSLLFSEDGAAYLWVAQHDGSVAWHGKNTSLPVGTQAARFRSDNIENGLVLTSKDYGVATWDPVTGVRTNIGGISSDDGVNYTGDVVGGTAISFYCHKPVWLKKQEDITAPVP